MVSGSCVCQRVRFECEPADHLVHCHCKMCRFQSGSAYTTVVRSPVESFRWTSGEEWIGRYESSPGALRFFCSQCGSKLPVVDTIIDASEVIVMASLLDQSFLVRSEAHWFVAEKAPWIEIPEGTDAFDAWPPRE